ncbi:hypothetical protein ACPUEK_10915 [Marinomonas gallaica]|uniref:hypothetical protein n=1 Tax=Marinomonas gallaica TaxID=1806667 RepID=UPI003CE46D51
MRVGAVMGSKFFLSAKCDEMTDEMREQSKTQPFYFTFFCCCSVLLYFITDEVRIFTDKGWYLQPVLGPAIGLSIMTLMSFIKTIQGIAFIKHVSLSSFLHYIAQVVSIHRITFWAIGAFYVYIHLLSLIGFLPSNLVLLMFMLFITKKLNRYWALIASAVAIGIVVIFRVVVGLWMDDVWLYSLLPDAAADFCNMYL